MTANSPRLENKKHSTLWRESIAPISVLLVMLTAWWAFLHYSPFLSTTQPSNTASNNEWLFLLDALITLPLACLLLIKDKKKALIKGVLLASLALVVGSYLLPNEQQHWLPALMDVRFVVLGLMVALEVITIISVLTLIRTEFNAGNDLDSAILKGISSFIPEGVVQKIMWFEGRMWACLLMSKTLASLPLKGDKHFSYWQKDGTHTNALGFIFVIAIEIPVVHVLLHFIWSPFAANVVTALSVFSLIFVIAERNAMKLRPISLLLHSKQHSPQLVIRYGLSNPITLPVSEIASISLHNTYVKRAAHIKRFNYSGVPNIKILLKDKGQKVTEYYLGVDAPERFIEALEHSKQD